MPSNVMGTNANVCENSYSFPRIRRLEGECIRKFILILPDSALKGRMYAKIHTHSRDSALIGRMYAKIHTHSPASALRGRMSSNYHIGLYLERPFLGTTTLKSLFKKVCTLIVQM